jgi:glucose/arabinose dehydrogenase
MRALDCRSLLRGRGRLRRSYRPFVEALEDRTVPAPVVLDPNLDVRPVVPLQTLSMPTSMAFIGANDFFILEKDTGQVKRVVNGAVQGVALDLAVNNNSERGLLGIALHPSFPTNPRVYLYYTQSTTGADTNVIGDTPLLGNVVERFVWNGSALLFEQSVISLRALQPANPGVENGQFGNHDGGVIRFGPDGKLYIFIGDVGRRGQMQNLADGHTPGQPDDQFGGPQPDGAHLTGVVLRLNDDGTAPGDNPFFAVGAALGGEVGANIQKIYSYGHRNSFGLAFDTHPRGVGNLWLQENADNAFSELNRLEPGMNGGWIQFAGPVERIAEFKFIETTMFGGNLQQTRYPPTRIADSPQEALERLFMLPGATYSDPEFSWKFEIAPAGIGFLNSRALGPQYEHDLFMGAARTGPQFLLNGYLFRFNLTGNRDKIGVDDPRLADRVADNLTTFDLTESEMLVFGTDFGVGTDIQTGPNGNLYVVSLSDGTVYEIFRRPRGRSSSESGAASLTAARSVAADAVPSESQSEAPLETHSADELFVFAGSPTPVSGDAPSAFDESADGFGPIEDEPEDSSAWDDDLWTNLEQPLGSN